MSFKDQFINIVIDGIKKGEINLSEKEVTESNFGYDTVNGEFRYFMPEHFLNAIPQDYLEKIEDAWILSQRS